MGRPRQKAVLVDDPDAFGMPGAYDLGGVLMAVVDGDRPRTTAATTALRRVLDQP